MYLSSCLTSVFCRRSTGIAHQETCGRAVASGLQAFDSTSYSRSLFTNKHVPNKVWVLDKELRECLQKDGRCTCSIL